MLAFLALLSLSAQQRAGLGAWDTGSAAAEPLAPATMAARTGWTPVAGEAAAVKGDLVLANGRVVLVLRKQGAGGEFYAEGSELRTQLVLETADGDRAARLERASVVENTKGAVAIEVAYKTAKRATVTARLRLRKGDVSAEVSPGAGAGRLRVECPSRFVVLPDFFADDIVIDAAKLPVALAELPSESFLMHLAGRGDSIVMAVFENREQDVKVTLAGEGEKRAITGSEIEFGKEKKAWVALLEAPGVWHAADVKAGDAKKILPLAWKMPYVAQWRVDFTRSNDLTDSWEMLLQKEKGGEYLRPHWLDSGVSHIKPSRERWTTVLGTFLYPCWSDPERNGFIQPLDRHGVTFRGPLVVYPVNRAEETPTESYTVVDVVRNTLGVGPCKYLLDLEGQKQEYKGEATCGVRDILTGIYSKGQQKQKRDEVEQALNDALEFVKHIRGRIARYVDFMHALHATLDGEAKAHPELKDPIAALDAFCAEIDARYAAREEKIRTPAYVAGLNDDFRKNVKDYEGADALDRCKAYTKALVEVGDNQDELSGECRWVVKTLRQKAALLLATEPRMAKIATEVRAKTQEILRNPAHHEGARH